MSASARAPRFQGYQSSSTRASHALAGSRATDTTCEKLLRGALWRSGLRYRKHYRNLPGRPDVVLVRERIAVFCDGDFWHGRGWRGRRERLRRGANSKYWVAKIKANMDRDRRQTKLLRELGWKVIRLWETDILRDPAAAARRVARLVRHRREP